MGRIKSNKMAESLGWTEQKEESFAKYTPISLFLKITAIMIMMYLTAKYFGVNEWGNYTLMFTIMGILSIVGVVWLNKGNIIILQMDYLKDSFKAVLFGVYIVLLIFIIALIMFISQTVFRLTLSTEDLYMYYVAGAIIEEGMFRMFIVYFFMVKTKIKYFGIIISSIIFMFSHWEVYGQSPDMMLAVLLSGIMFGIFYVMSKDITITMIAHIIINLIAVGNILLQVA